MTSLLDYMWPGGREMKEPGDRSHDRACGKQSNAAEARLLMISGSRKQIRRRQGESEEHSASY